MNEDYTLPADQEPIKLSTEEFTTKAIELVAKATYCFPSEISVVWQCWILGNQKALLTTGNSDGLYFEVTYNVDKNEFYFDAYGKKLNVRVKNWREYDEKWKTQMVEVAQKLHD